MREISFLNPPPVYIEVSPSLLLALRENDGLEIPLEREAGGNLKAGCKETIITALRLLAGAKSWQPRARAYCAIGASGVSLRRLSLPASAKGEFQKLLRLQIESEFPLSPEELAWGWSQVETNGGAKRDVLVAAVKKETIEEYAAIFSACGLNPVFTLAALMRNQLCPQSGGTHALLDIGGARAELATFENGVASAVRLLPSAAEVTFPGSLLKALGGNWRGRTIFLTGADESLRSQPGQESGGGVDYVPVKTEIGTGRSAAILGLKQCIEQNGGPPPLVLQIATKPQSGQFNLSKPEIKLWLKRAAILLALLLVLPYAEALMLKPLLARRLSKLNAEKSRLATIDRELDFLQYLKQNQPPYLDALFVFAKSAPPGAKIDSLTMNRRGEVSMRGSMQTGQLVTDFRTKLMATGFFSNVTVEEQTPTPDRQKVNVRMSALWKSAGARAGLAIGPSLEEIERAKTNTTAQAGGAIPPGMMPPGTPPLLPGQMPAPRPARK